MLKMSPTSFSSGYSRPWAFHTSKHSATHQSPYNLDPAQRYFSQLHATHREWGQSSTATVLWLVEICIMRSSLSTSWACSISKKPSKPTECCQVLTPQHGPNALPQMQLQIALISTQMLPLAHSSHCCWIIQESSSGTAFLPSAVPHVEMSTAITLKLPHCQEDPTHKPDTGGSINLSGLPWQF